MALFEAEGLVALVLVLFWVWAIIDVISTDEALARNLPRLTWLLIVLILPDIGALCWVLLGRPEAAGFWPGTVRGQRRTGPTRPAFTGSGPYGPDSSPRYLTEHNITDRRSAQLDDELAQWESKQSDLTAREEALREREAAVAEREQHIKDTPKPSS